MRHVLGVLCGCKNTFWNLKKWFRTLKGILILYSELTDGMKVLTESIRIYKIYFKLIPRSIFKCYIDSPFSTNIISENIILLAKALLLSFHFLWIGVLHSFAILLWIPCKIEYHIHMKCIRLRPEQGHISKSKANIIVIGALFDSFQKKKRKTF